MSADDICDQIRVGAKWLTVHQCLRDEHLPSASRCHLGMERATPPSRRSSSWRSCWQFVVTSECRLPHELVCCRKSAHEVEVEIRTFAFKFIKEEFLDNIYQIPVVKWLFGGPCMAAQEFQYISTRAKMNFHFRSLLYLSCEPTAMPPKCTLDAFRFRPSFCGMDVGDGAIL